MTKRTPKSRTSCPDTFELEQEPFCIDDLDIARSARTTYRELEDAKKLAISSAQNCHISKIAELCSPGLHAVLIEANPNIKIGNIFIDKSRANNPRILNIHAPKEYANICALIMQIKESFKLSSLERGKYVIELKRLGIERHCKCDPYEFMAVIMRVDSKTLRNDEKNANKD